MDSMLVAVFQGADRPIDIQSVPLPRPGEGDVLLRIARCGICGSDLSMTSGSPFDYPAGRALGHEYAGEVVELGPGVRNLRVGDRVACLPNGFCGSCPACREGRPIFCTAGRPLAGGMGHYMAAPETSLVPLPEGVSLADGALVEPMACGRRALRAARFRPGTRLLVLGGGAMALSVIFWARLQGAGDITVVSRSGHRREAAMALGADRYLSEQEDDPALLDALRQTPPDLVAECVGKTGMLERAINWVRPAGTVLSMGMCMHAEPLLPVACAFREVTLLFPLAYSMEDFQRTVDAFSADAVEPSLMVSHTVGLDELPETFDRLRAGARTLKVLVDPHRSSAHT